MSELSEDFSLDGLSAKATDGGSPLLGDECELGLSVSGNAGSVRYKFVWEQGGWSRWGSIRQGEPSASCPWTPEVAGDVNIWVDAIDSAGRVTTRKFPVHVDACRLSVDGGSDLEWSPGMKVAIRAAAAPGAKLKFVWQKDSWAEWGVVQGPSEATSCAWEPASSGSYRVYVDVSVGGLSATSVAPVSITEDFSLDQAFPRRLPTAGRPCSATVRAGPVRLRQCGLGQVQVRLGAGRAGASLGQSARASLASCPWTPEGSRRRQHLGGRHQIRPAVTAPVPRACGQ
ncbi:MAG: hypothetical protein ACLS3Y_00490 [Collinsella sp.]